MEKLDEFLYILSLIGEADDPDYLPFLFTYVSDTSKYEGIYYWLVLVIMGHDSEALIKYLQSSLKDYYQKFPICLCEFYERFLDIPKYLQILKDNVQIADKQTFLDLLNYVERYSSDERKTAINELRKLLDNGK